MEVLIPTGVFTAAAYVALYVAKGDKALALLVAAIVCAISLLVLLYLWHAEGRPVHITEHERYVDEPPRRLRPVVGSSDANRLIVGRFDFTETEWQRLGRVLATGKVTRALLADLQLDDGAPMFSSLTERYPSIVEELEREGFIDDRNETTQFARDWYKDRGIPLPE